MSRIESRRRPDLVGARGRAGCRGTLYSHSIPLQSVRGGVELFIVDSVAGCASARPVVLVEVVVWWIPRIARLSIVTRRASGRARDSQHVNLLEAANGGRAAPAIGPKIENFRGFRNA